MVNLIGIPFVSEMYVVVKSHPLMLVLVFSSQCIPALSQKCVIEKKSGTTPNPFVLRDCEAVNFKSTLAGWREQLELNAKVKLIVTDNKITTIEEEAFSRNFILQLEIRNNSGLTSVHPNILRPLIALQSLTIFEPHLLLDDLEFPNEWSLREISFRMKAMNKDLLNKLPYSLERLTIKNTRIGSKDEFVIMKNNLELTEITICECNLRGFAFERLTALTYLDLSTNQLRYWQNFTASEMQNLRFLNLKDNQFVYFDDNAIKGFGRLEELLLDQNYITNITKDIFKAAKQLKYVRNSYCDEEGSSEVFLRTRVSNGWQVEHIRLTKTSIKMFEYVALFVVLLFAFISGIIIMKSFKGNPPRPPPTVNPDAVVEKRNNAEESDSDDDFSLRDLHIYDVA